jgi:hypothetical protein
VKYCFLLHVSHLSYSSIQSRQGLWTMCKATLGTALVSSRRSYWRGLVQFYDFTAYYFQHRLGLSDLQYSLGSHPNVWELNLKLDEIKRLKSTFHAINSLTMSNYHWNCICIAMQNYIGKINVIKLWFSLFDSFMWIFCHYITSKYLFHCYIYNFIILSKQQVYY